MTDESGAYLTDQQRTLLRRFMNHVGVDEEQAIYDALGEIDALRARVAELEAAGDELAEHLDIRLGHTADSCRPQQRWREVRHPAESAPSEKAP